MLYADSVVMVSLCAQEAVFGDPAMLDTAHLLFGPVRLIALIAWVFLCMYCAQRVEFSPLISPAYKPIATALSLVIGPFLFFILAVADLAARLQDGDTSATGALASLFGGIFVTKKMLGARIVRDEDFIELLDAGGKDFFSDPQQKERQALADQETLNLTRRLVLNGIKQRASDILIDPKSSGIFTVRYRIDGFLYVVDEVSADKCRAVVNSIKAISGMDISERRRSLDGSFMARIKAGDVYFRVASAGVLGGEKLSLRILNQATGMLKLDEIGLSDESVQLVREAVNQPQGMIVVCGPTGSGKTTTLYAMMNEIDFYTRNVVTVEDPIEYVLPHASQIEVNPKANITFANSLRSILRQDPDVISVGEIRDDETAGMAIQAAHTGHLVLATLHSSSNLATIARLIDLGVKPLMLGSALNVVISQRLVRRLCENCKEPATLDAETAAALDKYGFSSSLIMQPGACKKCNQTGYLGRVAIVDVMHLDDEIKALLISRTLTLGDLKRDGDTRGRSNLRREGLKKVAAGATTIEEVKRVTSNLG